MHGTNCSAALSSLWWSCTVWLPSLSMVTLWHILPGQDLWLEEKADTRAQIRKDRKPHNELDPYFSKGSVTNTDWK